MVKPSQKSAHKFNALVQLALVLVLIVLLYVLGQYFFKRIDLTTDKRYTLSNQTKELLDDLDQTIYVKMYLDGDNLEPGLLQLRDATKELLDEMRVYSNGHIEYSLVDPYKEVPIKDRYDYFEQLQSRGLRYVDVNIADEGATSVKRIWPSAMVSLGEKEEPINLLQSQGNRSPQITLHNSIIGAEFEIAMAIHRLLGKRQPSIAIVGGHGELSSDYLASAMKELGKHYYVERLSLPSYKPGKLEQYDCAIVAKPDSAFTDVDLYKLDQYIMHGGKVLWFLDALHAHPDSLRKPPGWTITDKYPLKNLQAMLFSYGVRLNNNLVQDYSAHSINVMMSNRPARLKWPFYPVTAPEKSHPVVKGLGAIWWRFASSLDTVSGKSQKVDKHVLITSSENSKALPHPVRIAMNAIRYADDPKAFTMGPQILAVELDGEFTSHFANRLAPETLENEDFGEFAQSSSKTKMIVVADGDVIANKVQVRSDTKEKVFLPLGQDQAPNPNNPNPMRFDNLAFVLNCVDYLVDDSGLFTLRNKNYKTRLLNAAKVKEEGTFWKAFNLIVPILLVVVLGLVYTFIRKKRYT